jgi:hypothetical protein
MNFMIGFLLGACIAVAMLIIAPVPAIKREAIEHNFAEYNSTNGQWQWKALTNR